MLSVSLLLYIHLQSAPCHSMRHDTSIFAAAEPRTIILCFCCRLAPWVFLLDPLQLLTARLMHA